MVNMQYEGFVPIPTILYKKIEYKKNSSSKKIYKLKEK